MNNHSESRRSFLRNSSATVTGAALSTAFVLPPVHAGGSDVIRVGLIGCGNRGRGAAEQACATGNEVRLTALGEMFPDYLDYSKKYLRTRLGDKYAVKEANCFTGFDAYEHVINSGVDVVLQCTPPHFRPAHMETAIAAGKHIFAEKPVAVDALGIRRVFAACEEAKKKKLNIVSGLCTRYDPGLIEAVQRVHDGAIGKIVALQCTYNTGFLWHKPRQPEWSDMEWQLRNWLYFTWLSGDHNVEQHVHSLDRIAWVMHDEYPMRCHGMGGRQARTQPEFGHIFDHHSVVYEYADGRRLFSNCRQIEGCHKDVSDQIIGEKGTCSLYPQPRITGPNRWRYRRPREGVKDVYQLEHDDLFDAIRTGRTINQGDYMTKSTLMAIMGRMATYTGQMISWNQALNSQEDLTPPSYEFGSLPVPPVAVPGRTKFV